MRGNCKKKAEKFGDIENNTYFCRGKQMKQGIICIKANDYKKIKKVIDENADIIVSRWNEYFSK